MGVLGLDAVHFLSDRIFYLLDGDNDGKVLLEFWY